MILLNEDEVFFFSFVAKTTRRDMIAFYENTMKTLKEECFSDLIVTDN